jgi:4-diphosphocytidyl-2-C-methyl-D-erythritol kinase
VTRLAPAKLNLTLAVLGPRDDGYHDLHSVMVPLALADRLTVAVAASAATADSLRIEGSDDSLGAGPDNLVLRAFVAARAAVLAAQPGAPAPFLDARLEKVVPVAAGLGGGSSDAAAALVAALRAWDATLPAETMSAVAASLGSDVPFFLAEGPAVVTGRGEHVAPLPPLRGVAPAVLLVTPRLHVSTRDVFAAYAAGARPATAAALAASEGLAADLRGRLPATALLDRAAELAAANDLMPATLAVAPRLASLRASLEALLGRPVGQSGSGPTLWALYGTLDGAEKAAAAVGRDGLRLPAKPFVAATGMVTGAE